jgi:hypothetical protein
MQDGGRAWRRGYTLLTSEEFSCDYRHRTGRMRIKEARSHPPSWLRLATYTEKKLQTIYRILFLICRQYPITKYYPS